MTANRGGPELELLVTTDDQSFGSAVVDAVERAGVAASARRVAASGGSTQRDTDECDGAIVDGRIAEPAAVVERLTEQADLPVVVLTESAGDDDTVARAIEAGATDVFPRTAASAQCELIVDRIVGGVQDVTDRRRITRRLRAILERIDEAVYVTWAEELTTPSLHPDDFCAGYEDVWGQPLEEIFETYEEGFFGTLHPEEQEGLWSFLADIGADLDSGSVSDRYSHAYRIERADGEHRWIRSDFYPTEWETGPLRMVIVSRDVTERKRREQRLEVFNRILRHNLRNQLDVIRSHAEELADRTAGDHAERIVAAVDELAGIGRRARDLDRILSKNETLTDVDIAQTLRETVETMAAMGSDVTVTTELPKEARLRTDEETVTMAVESALENALEHAASAVTVAVEDGPDGCVITIADDGPGIPAEALRPIEAETETRLQHGRGLGRPTRVGSPRLTLAHSPAASARVPGSHSGAGSASPPNP